MERFDSPYGDLGRRMLEVQHAQQMKAQAESAALQDAASTARAAEATREALEVLVQHTVEADTRERLMLRWTRISGWAAIVAALLSALGIVVALLLT